MPARKTASTKNGRSTVASRKKDKAKKDRSIALKRVPSKSAAAIRQAQQLADREAVELASRNASERGSRRRNVDTVSFDTEHELEANDFEIGQDSHRDLSVDGDAELEPKLIQRVDGPQWKDKAALLAFNESKIEILVHDTTDKNESKIVETWVDGRPQRFMRNRAQIVRRKYAEALARAKNTAFSQENFKDGQGYDAIRNHEHTALRFPFSVIRDPHPNGAAWLRALLAEA